MKNSPKFSWGDVVVVSATKQIGSICGFSETDDGFTYTVEFGDGSDQQIAESLLEDAPNHEK